MPIFAAYSRNFKDIQGISRHFVVCSYVARVFLPRGRLIVCARQSHQLGMLNVVCGVSGLHTRIKSHHCMNQFYGSVLQEGNEQDSGIILIYFDIFWSFLIYFDFIEAYARYSWISLKFWFYSTENWWKRYDIVWQGMKRLQSMRNLCGMHSGNIWKLSLEVHLQKLRWQSFTSPCLPAAEPQLMIRGWAEDGGGNSSVYNILHVFTVQWIYVYLL